jgi:HAD superfamily hydrolase (TIGR01509 family)
MIRAIVFDFYGVLAINGWQAFKAEHFADREEVWDQVYQLGRQVDAGLSDYAELVRFTAEATGESEATVRYQLEHTVANTELLDFIAADLKGRYKLGILSNTSNDEVFSHIFTPDQLALFDEVTLSRHLGVAKPDTRVYEAMASKLDLLPKECLFIDDREHHVDGAREAGMRAILFTNVAELKGELVELA